MQEEGVDGDKSEQRKKDKATLKQIYEMGRTGQQVQIDKTWNQDMILAYFDGVIAANPNKPHADLARETLQELLRAAHNSPLRKWQFGLCEKYANQVNNEVKAFLQKKMNDARASGDLEEEARIREFTGMIFTGHKDAWFTMDPNRKLQHMPRNMLFSVLALNPGVPSAPGHSYIQVTFNNGTWFGLDWAVIQSVQFGRYSEGESHVFGPSDVGYAGIIVDKGAKALEVIKGLSGAKRWGR
jgi:hypothetical protein